eukprot:TRINITY_DN20317_c0_g3_i1.p1 TRINITY_DN20317_c0_g3~~TRINITY_DN20317_c0_g3_i1.p1  ORF type:complete len:190 (-),score=27.03 TRINITY_DN20317_c0_g3_i1:152-721(-)
MLHRWVFLSLIVLDLLISTLSIPTIPDGFSAIFVSNNGVPNMMYVDCKNELYLSTTKNQLGIESTLASCGSNKYGYNYYKNGEGPCVKFCMGDCTPVCLRPTDMYWAALQVSTLVGNCTYPSGMGELWVAQNFGTFATTYSYCWANGVLKSVGFVSGFQSFSANVTDYNPVLPDPSVFALPVNCSGKVE